MLSPYRWIKKDTKIPPIDSWNRTARRPVSHSFTGLTKCQLSVFATLMKLSEIAEITASTRKNFWREEKKERRTARPNPTDSRISAIIKYSSWALTRRKPLYDTKFPTYHILITPIVCRVFRYMVAHSYMNTFFTIGTHKVQCTQHAPITIVHEYVNSWDLKLTRGRTHELTKKFLFTARN